MSRSAPQRQRNDYNHRSLSRGAGNLSLIGEILAQSVHNIPNASPGKWRNRKLEIHIDGNGVYQDLDFVWDFPGNIIRHWLMPKRGRIMGTC